jgi:predicted ABC-type ATPase
MPQIYLIGGPNGAGKTTSAIKLLADFLGIYDFVNADTIAQGISAFNFETVSIGAGKIMLNRIYELITARKSFAFETTLASKIFVNVLNNAKKKGYTIHIIYIWLRSVELAIERVKARVETGGHSVAAEVITRRYENGRKNFITLYMSIADGWQIYDNSENEIRLIAQGISGYEKEILDEETFNKVIRL